MNTLQQGNYQDMAQLHTISRADRLISDKKEAKKKYRK